MNKVGVWDLDGTIRPGCLLTEAIEYSAGRGFVDISRFPNPANPRTTDLYNFAAALAGRPLGDFNKFLQRLSENARERSFPWAIEELKHQQKAGYKIIIVSHSPDFLVKAVAKGLGERNIAYAFGSWCQILQHKFSGHAVLLNKATALAKYRRRTGMPNTVFAAGNGMSDEPILKQAERAVAVNPNRQLGDLAIMHGWDVIIA